VGGADGDTGALVDTCRFENRLAGHRPERASCQPSRRRKLLRSSTICCPSFVSGRTTGWTSWERNSSRTSSGPLASWSRESVKIQSSSQS
jgi:hypothetical protein